MTSKSSSVQGAHYLKDILACDRDSVGAILEVLGDGAELLDQEHLPGFLVEGMDDEFLDQVLGDVGLIGGVDPVQALERLRKEGVDVKASPIHALGHLNHISGMPGTDPVVVKVKTSPNLPASSPGQIVAVVDSGVGHDKNLPTWLESGIHPSSDRERVRNGKASHGTFVAGLIRRIAPEHTILVMRARPVPIEEFVIDFQRDPGLEADDPTTELHVYEAIFRLVRELRGKSCDLAALNLSLGGAAAGRGDPLMVMLELAIDYWRNAFPHVPVFAAGGNRESPDPIFPGAFGHVRSVAASIEDGVQVVWDPNTPDPPQPYPGRGWINEVAPGSKLVSPSGASQHEWVEWSGSSFATAVATGCHASRRSCESVGGLNYWTTRATEVAGIPGLVV